MQFSEEIEQIENPAVAEDAHGTIEMIDGEEETVSEEDDEEANDEETDEAEGDEQ